MIELYRTSQKIMRIFTSQTWIQHLLCLYGYLRLNIHFKRESEPIIFCENCNGGYHLFCLVLKLLLGPKGFCFCLCRVLLSAWLSYMAIPIGPQRRYLGFYFLTTPIHSFFRIFCLLVCLVAYWCWLYIDW